jgi:hypothetical protein
MMHEFIMPKDMYNSDNGHMVDNDALCDWASESQGKMCIVHYHFEHYLSV